MESEHGPQLLADAVKGDLTAFLTLSRQDHSSVKEYAAQVGELILLPVAVRRVLLAFQQGQVSPSLVQRWASFMRRGYITEENTSSIAWRQPIRPIEISYDSSAEEQIVEVMSRLDEIGDLVDGEVTPTEIERMLDELP